MCGIIGIFNMKNSEETTFSERDKAFLMKYLLTELTLETEPRGRDATGYCALFQDGEAIGLKHGVKASEFCTKSWDKEELIFRNHINLVEAYHNDHSPIASIISHCRAKTVGSESDNNNNHPIYVGDLVGIHNGCLGNHTKILNQIRDDITRVGEVDSEMIFQLLWLELKQGKLKFSQNTVKGVTEKLDGSFAVICLNKKDPNSVLFFRDTRPIEFIYIKKAGIIVAVSEKKFFDNCMRNYKWFDFYGFDLPEVEAEYYTFPDDKACTLDLGAKIEKGTALEDIFKPIVAIEKTSHEWKNYTTYPATTSRNQRFGVYGTEDYEGYATLDKYKRRARTALPGTTSATEDLKAKAAQHVVNDTTLTGDAKTIKKTEEKQNSETTASTIMVASWNAETDNFDSITEDFDDIYIKAEPLMNDKYTIFRSTKILATKLGVNPESVDTFTAAQLANRVSKLMYDEHVEKKLVVLKVATEKIEKFDKKAMKARRHIITLRSIINILIGILEKSEDIDYYRLVFNNEKREVLSKLWGFLYSSKKSKLGETTLGKFIHNLSQIDKKEHVENGQVNETEKNQN